MKMMKKTAFGAYSLVAGMLITLKYFFKPGITIQYPKKRRELPEGSRWLHTMTGMAGEGAASSCGSPGEMPPCMSACAANVASRDYIRLAAQGRFAESLALVREDIALPSVCGRVCTRPCETACKRNDFGDPIAINTIKRYVADYELRSHDKIPISKMEDNGKRVAVIGAGPAGLSAAFFLARFGYRVTIFEALPVAGGFLYIGIPSYRLPREILGAEVQAIVDLGVEIRYNTKVDSLDELFADGFEAVFIGVGALEEFELDIQGEELQGVYGGETFLKELALGSDVSKAKHVVVVGGGNTAIDCARSSMRLGAKSVTVLYRRTVAEMTAHHTEIEEAEEEGVEIRFLTAPKAVIGKRGAVCGIECLKMKLGERDASGRRRPIPIEGSEFIIEADRAITAIGRRPNLGWLENTGIEFTRRDTVQIDQATCATKRPGVYAGGDVVLGPGTATEAMGHGKKAALAIHAYLGGETQVSVLKKEEKMRSTLFEGGFVGEQPTTASSTKMPMEKLPAEERKHTFNEVEFGYTQEEAMQEAKRCLSCKLNYCVGCGYCRDVCPASCIEVGRIKLNHKEKIHYSLDLSKCMFCGFCVEVCPTTCLKMTKTYELASYDRTNMVLTKEDLLKGAKKR